MIYWTPPNPQITLPHQDPSYPMYTQAFYAELPIATLRFDYDYQRTKADAQDWADKTFKNFGLVPGLFGVLHVAEYKGEYYCWDGQGRSRLAVLAGKPKAMCLIVPNCSQPEQAGLFSSQENRRGLSWYDKHRAALVEGLPVSIEIEKILTSHGLVAGHHSGQKNSVRAIGALYWIYDRGGRDLLDDVIDTAANCWSHSKDGLKDRTLKGLAFFYQAFPARDVDRSIAKLAFKNVSPTQAIMEAIKETKISGGQNHTEVARYLLRAFNKETNRKLRSANLERNTDLRKRKGTRLK